MQERPDRLLIFEDVELDLDAAELRRAGSLIEVEPQVFDLIVFLATNAGRVVSRDEIIDAVWHGRVVSDSAISTRINAARRALGDDGKNQHFIRTLHGRGFRFLDRPLDKYTSPDTTAEKPSIAVLPFVNLSGDPQQEYFADGMAEDITAGLSRFRSLFVISRNSAFAYKGTTPDARDVARDLGVRYLLEGSVRRAGRRLRISAQLVDAEAGQQLWAERYDREEQDIFLVQDEATASIVAAIAPEIGEAERTRARRKSPGTLDSWSLYQRGLADYFESTEAGLRAAITQFDEVNTADPDFAPAFAMAAAARWRYVLHFEPENGQALLKQALDKSYRAITLDPRDPTGLWNAGEVHSMLGQHDEAITKVEEAIALNPNEAVSHYFLGSVLRRAGRGEAALPHIDHAMHLSPRDIFLTGMLTDRAFVLFDMGRYEEAFEWARRARLSPNPRTMTFALFAAVLSKLGRQDEARAAVEDLLTHAPSMTCGKYRENRFGTPEVMQRLSQALSDAGLPT